MRWKGNGCGERVACGPSAGAILRASEAEAELQDFKGLRVWKKAHALALEVYGITGNDLGRSRNTGLMGQSRRAAISIAANIAEGCARETQRDFAKFLNIAFASAAELEYHMILARDLDVIPRSQFRTVTGEIEEIRRMLTGLIHRVRASASAVPSPPL